MKRFQAYGISAVEGEVLAECGRWTLVRGAEPRRGDIETALERVMIELLPRAAATLDRRVPAFDRGTKTGGIIIVLGGDRERDFWDRSGTLAFHAIGTSLPGDPGLTGAPVNNHNVGVVAMDAAAEAMFDDQHHGSLELGVSVLPLTMFMVAAWLQASDGRSPLEVAAQLGGRKAIEDFRRQLDRASKDRGHPDGLCEEAAQVGLAIASRYATGRDLSLTAWQALRDCVQADQGVAQTERMR